MKSKIYILIFSLVLMLCACRPKPLDIAVQPQSPKLIIASQIIPSNVMAVLVTRSFSVLEEGTFVEGTSEISPGFIDKIIVQDALVTVSYDGIIDTLYSVDTIPGVYVSAKILQVPHQNYVLHVYDPKSDESVSASAQMLSAVKIDTIYPIGKTDSTVSLKFRFTDLPGQNWYLFNVYKASKQSGVANLDVNTTPFAVGENQLLQSQLITDLVYNKNLIEITTTVPGVYPTDTIGITFANITEGHFLFLSAQSGTGDLFGQFFHEPVNIPTNVINGFGYFSAYDPDVKIIDLNKY
ncbi:MAG: DUF4249 domain-containing protein [Bacteroidetes bacterium]|nr:DUF4249 domain-containing protein [Bacteroidota bacterium]